MEIIRSLKYSKEFALVSKLNNDKKYNEVLDIVQKITGKKCKDEKIYRLAINSAILAKKYDSGAISCMQFLKLNKMNSDDFAIAGFINSQLSNFKTAEEFYELSIRSNPKNKFALNNLGFSFICREMYADSIVYFDKAIEIDLNFPDAFCNRGLAKIKIGKTAEGREDLNTSFKYDKENSYYYRNLGMYHLDLGENSEALILFEKAKKLDTETYGIEELIIKASTISNVSNDVEFDM